MFPVLFPSVGARAGVGGGWENVEPPNAAFSSWPPFTIQRNGIEFRIDPTFSLQTYANISVSKTYYVDADAGSDANTGADWAHAKKTLNAINTAGDGDRIYLRGRLIKSQIPTTPGRSWEILGDTDAVLSSSIEDRLGGTWTAVDNHYETTITSEQAVNIQDAGVLDALGNPTWLTSVGSIVAVEAAVGTFFSDRDGTGKLYIRLADERAPDADVAVLGNLSFGPTCDNRTFYLYNLSFEGSTRARNATATGGLKVYIENCTFYNDWTVGGTDECIIINCTSIAANGDGFTYDDRNGVVNKMVEAFCEIYGCGFMVDENQCTSPHHDGIMVRVMGDYHDAKAQCWADSNGKTWALGSILRDAGNGVGAYFSADNVWLDRCQFDNDTHDIHISSGTTLLLRSVTYDGSVYAPDGGTVGTY